MRVGMRRLDAGWAWVWREERGGRYLVYSVHLIANIATDLESGVSAIMERGIREGSGDVRESPSPRAASRGPCVGPCGTGRGHARRASGLERSCQPRLSSQNKLKPMPMLTPDLPLK